LVVEVIRQLYEKYPGKTSDNKIHIKLKPSLKQKSNSTVAVDVKKINLQKSPEES